MAATLLFLGCNAPYDGELPPYEGEIVVEAYVNQSIPSLNYLLLSRSVAYYDPNLDIDPVGEAKVMVYPGVEIDGQVQWDRDNGMDWLPFEFIPGAYVPSQFGFVAEEETHYLLEIEVEGQKLSSKTYVPKMVKMDTLFVENIFNEKADSFQAFERMAFSDPKGFGNNYLVYRSRVGFQENPLTWGSMSLLYSADDEFFDGNSWGFSSLFPQTYGDTVTFYLGAIDRASYLFWDSYEISENNGGPFSQPINVNGNIEGGRGIFCGIAVDRRRVIITKP